MVHCTVQIAGDSKLGIRCQKSKSESFGINSGHQRTMKSLRGKVQKREAVS